MTTSSTVEYRVKVLPVRHELQVEMTLSGPVATGSVHLQIPTWVPGDYAFAPQARDLFNVLALCGVTNKALHVRRDGWQGYVVEEGAGLVHVSYTASAWGDDLSDTIGPSMTDTPIRMAVYFGNNARASNTKPVYGILASYDDETFTTFWQELEIGPNHDRKQPRSENVQTLDGPRQVPPRMVKMLRRQLAELHFGPNADYSLVPEPLEARYMDWSLPPFAAGYHAWAAHYDIADVQEKIRKPSQLVEGADADIFIVGEAYSNDQAWVEGAYCTAESVLNDFFEVEPIIDNTHYPFICRTKK